MAKGLKMLCAAVLLLGGVAGSVWAQTVTVFAASSLRDAVEDAAEAFEAKTGTQVVQVFAASSAVARQVAQGAPADVVLLADQAWADWLVAQDSVDRVVPFARNRLVLIGRDVAPFTDPADIEAALDDGVLAMAQVNAVPAGRYGKAAFEALGLWDALSERTVQAANVRAALRFVERREAPLGVGYASDLVALPALREVYSFAPETHPPIVYTGAATTPAGGDFLAFLQSDAGQTVLREWGFLAPGARP